MVEPLYRDKIKEKLTEYRQKKGFIISDHYYQDVLQIADKFLALTDGVFDPIDSTKD